MDNQMKVETANGPTFADAAAMARTRLVLRVAPSAIWWGKMVAPSIVLKPCTASVPMRRGILRRVLPADGNGGLIVWDWGIGYNHQPVMQPHCTKRQVAVGGHIVMSGTQTFLSMGKDAANAESKTRDALNLPNA